MKAIVLRENGGTDKLIYEEDYPVPKIKCSEALVKVKATSVNRIDIVIRNGYPGLNLKFPHIPGGDITGIIEKTGSDVKEFKEGDRVISWPIVSEVEDEFTRKGKASLSPSWKYFGMHLPGSYAEYAAVPESSLIKLPDNVSFEEAACLPIAGLTAYHAVRNVGNLQKDESFFIWGGTSGLGLIATQIAKSLGAKVFATAGTDEKINFLKTSGIENVFNHFEEKDITDNVIKITNGSGVDVVLDYIGPATHNQSFNMLKRGGKLLWCGIMTGREAVVSIHMTYLKHLSLLGLYLGEKAELEELVSLVSNGVLKPHIGVTMDLKDAGKAHTQLEQGKVIGKVVLKV